MSSVRLLAAAFVAGSTLAGCADEQLDPVAAGTADPVPTTTATTPPTNDPPKTKKRDVFTRNPFGNVAATQNLLWDGDFEWASPFGDQYGWIELPGSPTLSEFVVGPACKSGVKCARVGRNTEVIGIAVSSENKALDVSFWARFEPDAGDPMPPCSDVISFVLDLTGLPPQDDDAAVLPTSEAPDESGWCRFTASAPARNNKAYLYIENDSDTSIVLDDCTILATETMAFAQAPVTRLDEAARTQAKAAVRATRLPVDGAPNPVRDAYRDAKRR